MQSFLQDITNQIFESHKDELEDVSIIIPNKRAAVYIQKHLSHLVGKPFFSPNILTINEWIDQNTKAQILTQTEILFIFYKVYVSYEKEKSDSFNEFLKWAKIILADFDEVDRYFIEPQQIFKNLKDIKDIDNWSFEKDDLSEGQLKFLNLWEKLPIYYKLLQTKLKELNATYQGMAYQNFAKSCQLKNPSNSIKYFFIGFNAFSRSEEKIIEGLSAQNLAEVMYDVDQHYIQNKEHEAGHFYRKLVQKWQLKNKVPNLINEAPKKIEIIETAQQVAQAKLAGSLLKSFSKEELNKTAIILADESLLIPLSKSLPQSIEKVNITMGYPIKYSHLKSLIDTIFENQSNLAKYDSSRLYHKTILKILDHSYIKSLVQDDTQVSEFEKAVITKNQIYISLKELTDNIPAIKIIESLFKPWKDNTNDALNSIKILIQSLYLNYKEKDESHSIDLEILYHFSKGIKKFSDIWENHQYELNLKSFKELIYQFWQNETLSFLGNPIEGLQVMGILETRTLDFENIIVLGLNEGNLPKNNFSNSLIMRELKLFHGLPVEEDRDAIFAHHFYRLLHRSKRIVLSYNSNATGLGSGEKSRFITQIINELNKENHQITEYTYSGSDTLSNTEANEYQVNDKIIEKLDALFKRGLSPSALNTFLRCPLDFFYTYILNLREENEVEESIESSTFGTMIHEVLEKIFKINFKDKNLALSIDILENEKKNLKTYLEEEYLKVFKKSDFQFGQNKLSFEVSMTFLNQFIDLQIKELKAIDFPIFIHDLETDIEAEFEWVINGQKKLIKIKGQADRIDQFGRTYRIIDYKSGKCDKTKIEIPKKVLTDKSFESIFKSKENKKAYGIQLMMYATMFAQQNPEKRPFTAGIISMINIKNWIQNTQIANSESVIISDELIEIFQEQLKQVVEKIYDPNFVFKHNKDSKYCEYCEN